MENKYYTPDLEEFHFGFECEIQSSWGWQPGQWPDVIFEDTLSGFHSADTNFVEATKWADIRVKYLDQSDIESFGFKEDYDDAEGNVWFRLSSNDRWRLNFMEHTANNIWIVDDTDESYDDTVFKGVIKNKSELNKLLKQLNIIE